MNKPFLALLFGALSSHAVADDVYREVIVVTGQQPDVETTEIYTEHASPSAVDAVALVARLPGAAIVSNGSLSGQVQYRGVFGHRVSTRVNGQAFRSGGPNLMDPPLHYAPITLIESIEVSRGVAPVSFGPSLSSGVNASLKQVGYGATSEWQSHYDVTLLGRSADDSHGLGFSAGIANDQARVYGFFSDEEGNDQEYKDGDVRNTFHERGLFGAGFGMRWQDTEFELEVRRHDTEPTGNPSFAMDIDYVESDFARSSLKTLLGSTQITASLGYSDVEHGMNNFAHRPPPALLARYRQNSTSAQTKSFGLAFVTPITSGELDYGVDIETHQHQARISNPNNVNFFVTQVPNVDQDRLGAYLNWQGDFARGQLEAGIRVDSYDDSGNPAEVGPALPAGPNMLATAYNNADRDWSDTAVDGLVRYSQSSSLGTWRMSLARKHRAPVYLERYAWLPTAASSGLADGNNYVGDLNLDIETAWVAEVGIDLTLGAGWLQPSVYYQRVDDYIQGTPIDVTPTVVDSPAEMVSGMNGDPSPLRFSNVDARLYGVDASFGWQFSRAVRLEGVASLVRGDRRDINDDLYRISPDKLSMSLVYEPSNWLVALEAEGVRKQNKVSQTNGEQETAGYGLVNLFGRWQVTEQFSIAGGIDNVMDKDYELHLGGYNRIQQSDVAVGERLPGVGRNAFLRLSYHR